MSPRLYTAAEVMAHVASARASGFRAGVEHAQEAVEHLFRLEASPEAIKQWLLTTLRAMPYEVDPVELDASMATLRAAKSGA